jgi:hypothetical protein
MTRPSRRWSALSAVLLIAVPSLALAAFDRVGPTMSGVGYPQWYQDATGITLEFCSITNAEELNGGHCLLLPGDTTFPESFPDAFADEHFYWAADAVGTWTFGGQSSGARLILGLEAAFAIGPPIPGDQVVFGRLRIRVDDLPLSGTYTIYTPYGKYVFPNQVAGERLFYTEDIGLQCARGDFTCALQSSLGPFLLPSSTPGGAELPPVTGPAPGKLYIADPGRSGPVTGSPLPEYEVAGGETRNPNMFRVEGPGGVLLFETTNFTLQGRLFSGTMPGRVEVDRASYARTASAQQVDVFATAFPTREPRLPAAPIVEPVVPELSLYAAPCGGTVAPDGDVLPPFTAPEGVGAIPMAHNGSAYWVQATPAVLPTAVCVVHTNARDTSGQISPVYVPATLGDKVHISEATYDPDAGTLVVAALSADAVSSPALTVGAFGDVPGTLLEGGSVTIPTAAPPASVRVLSDQHGADEMQVTVLASSAAANQPPVAAPDAAETLLNTPVVIAVLDNDADPDGDLLLVSAASQPTNGAVTFEGGAAVTYTPNASFVGADAFTYTVTDGRGGFATTSVVVTVSAAANVAPIANPDAAITAFQTPVVIAVLANDTDPNGDPLSVTAVDAPASGTATTDGVLVTYLPPAGFSGVVAFNYTVSDGRGGNTAGLVTVTVRAQEVLTITRAQFRQPNEWRVDGTSTFEGATITIHSGSTLAGPVIGTTTVPPGGVWTFRSTTTGVPSNTRVSVESTGGAVRLNQQVIVR